MRTIALPLVGRACCLLIRFGLARAMPPPLTALLPLPLPLPLILQQEQQQEQQQQQEQWQERQGQGQRRKGQCWARFDAFTCLRGSGSRASLSEICARRPSLSPPSLLLLPLLLPLPLPLPQYQGKDKDKGRGKDRDTDRAWW